MAILTVLRNKWLPATNQHVTNLPMIMITIHIDRKHWGTGGNGEDIVLNSTFWN